jgi:hypothetical protein
MIIKLVLLLTLIPSISLAQFTEVNDIIRDPAISRRCKALLKERSEKIIVQQKITSLLMRNKKLQNKSLGRQKVVLGKLELLETRLKNNLRLTKLRVSSMEESLVRKGCPGITL